MTSTIVNKPNTNIIYVNLEKQGSHNTYEDVQYAELSQQFGSNPLFKKSRDWLIGVQRFHLNIASLPIVPFMEDAIQIKKVADDSVITSLDLPNIYDITTFWNQISSLEDNNINVDQKPLIIKLRMDGKAQVEYYYNGGTNYVEFDERLASILDLPIRLIPTPNSNNKIITIGLSSTLGRIDQLMSIQLISRQGLNVSSEIFNSTSLPILTDFIVDQLPGTSFTTSNSGSNGSLSTDYSVSFLPRDSILYNADNIRLLNMSGDGPIDLINVEFIARVRDYMGGTKNKRIFLRKGDICNCKFIFVNKN